MLNFVTIVKEEDRKEKKSYLNPIEVRKPFERIGIDFVEPLEKTRKKNKYILVITDYLTK